MDWDGRIGDHKIGTLEIFSEQRKCANDILDCFERHGGPPLLIAQMQQGKTGTAICVIDQFVKHCEAKNLQHNKDYEIIYLTNVADNELTGQTEERLLQAGLCDKLREKRPIHHADLRGGSFEPNPKVSVRLVIVDECHVALEKSTDEEFKPFHEFLKKCGINYGESIDTWQNKNNYVLSISATPFAHVIKMKIDDKSFEAIVLPVNKDYYSLQQMDTDKRFSQSKPVVINGKVTPWFKERIEEFLLTCQKCEIGHMVVRSIGAGPDAIKNFLSLNYPNVDSKIYGSLPTNNIKDVDRHLSKEFPKPFVAIIRGSLRAGKTLKTTKNIRMWIEPPSSKTDTMCQAVGRCLGYEMIDSKSITPCKNNRRFNDKFPVYCNTKELELAIEFYDKLECIPTGNNNKTTKSKRVVKIHVCNAEEITESKRVYLDDYKKNPNLYENKPLIERLKKSTVAGSEKRDFAREILNGKGGGLHNFHVYLNGPSKNEEYKDSWNKLLVEHPDWEGKITWQEEVAEDVDPKNCIDKDTIFYEDDSE